jgi:hypothetical protein
MWNARLLVERYHKSYSRMEYPTDSEYIKYYLLFAATFGHSSVVF